MKVILRSPSNGAPLLLDRLSGKTGKPVDIEPAPGQPWSEASREERQTLLGKASFQVAAWPLTLTRILSSD